MDADVCLDNLDAGVRWIHADASPAALEQLVAELAQRVAGSEDSQRTAQTPITTWHSGQRMAGSYFKLLSGNVATLGGARALPGWEQAAANSIIRQIGLLSDLGVPQVQAIVQANDLATAELVQRAGMQLQTEVEQQWLDVAALSSLASNASGQAAHGRLARLACPIVELRWRPADVLDHHALAQFIDETFADTLDCPALNGRRTAAQVLDGFLDGRQLGQSDLQWELLEVDGSVVGCLLLQAYEGGLMELVYMGLVVAARGRQLGKAMVARAIEAAHESACSNLVVAVDRDNWPAQNVYRDWGFQPHQRFQVWLLPIS